MSYNTIATAALDGDLQQRIKACAAQEGHPDPQSFMNRHNWKIAAHVNIAGPYESAVAAHNGRPGYWEAVIADGALLAVVQPLVATDIAQQHPG